MQPGLQRLGLTACLYWIRTTSIAGFLDPSLTTRNCKMSTTLYQSSSSENGSPRVLRVLALHGSEGTAQEFPSRLDSIQSILSKEHDIQLDITTVEGPFAKGSGFSWWTMKDGERSFNANEYQGFDTAAGRVLEAWDTQPPFDLCLGHSQGAIMLASLIALGKVPYHPPLGYIFNGVSFPNPYRKEMAALKVDKSLPEIPRVLFIMGTNDKITPNETGEELRDGLQNAGFVVQTIKHPGGHPVPNDKQPEALIDIAQWITNTT